MAFLDKIKSVEVEDAPKKVNPLLKKKLEPKKTIPTKPLKKIVLPKAVEETPEEDLEVEIPEASAEEKAPVKEEAAVEVLAEETPDVSEEAATEEAPEKTAEPVLEEPNAEVTNEEKEEAVLEVAKEVKEEVKEEETTEDTPTEASEEAAEEKPAPKAKRQTRSKRKAVSETTEEASVEMPTTSMNFSSAVTSISSPFVDEDWESFKEEVMSELGEIHIAPDMNPGTLKVVIAELSMLREKIWYPYQEAKNLYERLSSKEPEGLIERVKRINLGTGANDMERRKAGVMACMSFETPEGPVNLFEMMDESKERYTFLRGVIDSIKYKTDILITLNGALKLEKEHI